MTHGGESINRAEFFVEIVERVVIINSSFNKDAFPLTTESLLQKLEQFIEANTFVLQIASPVENQLHDAVLDFHQALYAYRMKSDTKVKVVFQRRDFVTARIFFKVIVKEHFYNLLTPKTSGVPSPITVWRTSARSLGRLIGV